MRGMCDRTKLLELKKPRMVAEAAEKRKGLNIVLEILVFLEKIMRVGNKS